MDVAWHRRALLELYGDKVILFAGDIDPMLNPAERSAEKRTHLVPAKCVEFAICVRRNGVAPPTRAETNGHIFQSLDLLCSAGIPVTIYKAITSLQ